jgi:type I restriction enzyme S subunit
VSFSDWREVRIGEVISFNPSESLKKGEIAKKIAMEQLEPFTRKIANYELSKFTGGSKFRNGDTLFARITPCLENGKTAYVNILDDNEVAFGSTEFIVMRKKEKITDDMFVYYLAISPDFRNKAIQSMTGTSGRQRVQQDVLQSHKIMLPPLHEQKAIAATLSALDDMIELNNQINKILEEMVQAIFKSWFVDFEPFKDEEFEESELGLIPKGWRVAALDEIATYLNGLAMQKYPPSKNERGLPVLKIKELRQGFTDGNSDICSESIDNSYIINDGDIIFSWSGSLLVDIWCGGRCGLNQHLFKVTSASYNKWFYYMWTRYHLERFIAIAKDKATTMGHIQRKHLSEAKVLIPEPNTLAFMDSVMQPIIDLVIANKVENKTLSTIRDTLLPKLMTGEIRVPVEEVV